MLKFVLMSFCWVQAPVSFGGFTALSRLRYCSLLCFSSLLLGYFSFAQRVEPRLGCVRIFFSGFRRCFPWVDDWSPSTALGRAPQTPLDTLPIFFFYQVRLRSSKIYSLFNPSFWVSAIVPLLLFLILHFSIWNLVAGYLFVCVCDVLGVALFRLSSFFLLRSVSLSAFFFFCNLTFFFFS